MYTNNELAKLNQLFKSTTIGDLQVSYGTHLAISKIAKAVEDALKPVADVETKYIQDGQEDELYQEFIAGQNQLRKDKPEDLGLALAQYVEDNQKLTENQRERTQGFQAVLDAEADIEIERLKEEDYPDLFAADLTNSEWKILGLVLEQ